MQRRCLEWCSCQMISKPPFPLALGCQHSGPDSSVEEQAHPCKPTAAVACFNACPGSWTGGRQDSVTVDCTELFFRGRRILDATITALVGIGISNSDVTDIVIGGGSAGALGT